MKALKEHFITADRPYVEGEVFHFAQDFTAGEVKRATLIITALGVYEASLGGEKIGDQLFAPGFTYYPHDLYYQVYDVTNMLNAGNNRLSVYLGQGWYCGRFTFENKCQMYGEQAAVSWVLEIEEESGIRTIVSDESVALMESPYDYAGLYDGEVYVAGRDTRVMGHAIRFEGKLPEHMEQTAIAVKVQAKMPIITVTQHGDVTILDFGQNFAGIVDINPAFLAAGDTITLRHGEILTQDGRLYTENLRKAKQTIVYYANGDKRMYRPRFTYMGFRYVELSGCAYQPGLIGAHAIYSDMQRTGDFHCDNAMVQRLYDNQLWGQKSNYVEVPTDCPQRDERMGYTGDGQVYAITGSYNYDTEQFLAKFLKDIRYSQMDNTEGYIGSIAPANGPGGIGFLSMLGWGTATTRIPEILYWQYGTDAYLRAQYDSMKTFVEAVIRKMDGENLWIGVNLGDWLMPGKDMGWMAQRNNPVSNSFIVNDLRILTETARRLGLAEDEARYAMQLELTRDAYMTRFVAADGTVDEDYQGAYVMALQYVIPEGDLRRKVLAKLVANVRANGLQTGFFATEFLLPLLVEAGGTKLAFDTLMQEDCPGWMYQIKQGATTIWERWDAIRPDGTVNEDKMSDDNMVSFNHYAFGSVGEFYYQHILGIRPLEPGFAKVLIAPVTDERLGTVSGSYASRAGKISVKWAYEGSRIRFAVDVPVCATIRLPDGQTHEVGAGSYTYDIAKEVSS